MTYENRRKAVMKQWIKEREEQIRDGVDSTEAWRVYLSKLEHLEAQVLRGLETGKKVNEK